jgi:5-methylthioadenosine/S-adenosylhomocysteine deaminase
MPDNAGLGRRTLLKLGTAMGAGLALPTWAQAATAPTAIDPAHLVIRHATVLTMDPKLGDMLDCDVLIKDGQILAVGKSLAGHGAVEMDATGMILIPGLVDAHWHLWNSVLRSSAPVPGGEAFFKTQQATSKRFTPELTELSSRLGLAEAAHSGITTVNNWAHNIRSPEFAAAELRALQASGLRARLWYGYAQDLAATAAMDFRDIERLQEQMTAAAYRRIDLGLAIRGPERTEADIWEGEFAFAKARDLPVSTHIAVSAAMQKKKAVQQLARRGLLTSKVQLVHGTHVDAEDIRSIAASGASVCLTPLTEMRVGYGLAPAAALHKGKVPVSLGIDTLVLSGNANPFMVMQTTLNLAIGMSGDEQAMTARDVLHCATQGGADGMGLGAQIGSITPGKRADLVLIDARRLGMFPIADPITTAVQQATPSDVDTVIADGRIIKRAGRLVGLDQQHLAAQARQALQKLL